MWFDIVIFASALAFSSPYISLSISVARGNISLIIWDFLLTTGVIILTTTCHVLMSFLFTWMVSCLQSTDSGWAVALLKGNTMKLQSVYSCFTCCLASIISSSLPVLFNNCYSLSTNHCLLCQSGICVWTRLFAKPGSANKISFPIHRAQPALQIRFHHLFAELT